MQRVSRDDLPQCSCWKQKCHRMPLQACDVCASLGADAADFFMCIQIKNCGHMELNTALGKTG